MSVKQDSTDEDNLQEEREDFRFWSLDFRLGELMRVQRSLYDNYHVFGDGGGCRGYNVDGRAADERRNLSGRVDRVNDPEIKRVVLEELNNARDPNDIILEACEKYGLAWPEAEALVRQVQEENRDTITLRHAPLLTALALASFFGGMVVLAIGFYPIVVVAATILRNGNFESLLHSGELFYALSVMVHTGLTPFAAIPLGGAMVLGSLIGMRDVWSAILIKLKIGPG